MDQPPLKMMIGSRTRFKMEASTNSKPSWDMMPWWIMQRMKKPSRPATDTVMRHSGTNFVIA